MTAAPSTEVVILCGGQGTRFRAVDPVGPKALAMVAGRPFLDILLDQFIHAGYERFILCVGYGADAIEEYIKDAKYNALIKFSREQSPRGTGGAVKAAAHMITGQHFFVANGDSYCDADLAGLFHFHMSQPDAHATMALTRSDERIDAGNVTLVGSTGKILLFVEKEKSITSHWKNAGIYVFNKKLFAEIPADQQISLEYEIFPKLVGRGLYGYTTPHPVIDIGTPERYNKAQEYFNNKI